MGSGRDQRTLKQDELPRGAGGTIPFLTVAGHPDATRVGDRQVVSFERDGRMAVSRFEPEFLSHSGGAGSPLDDPYVSRRPFHLRELDQGGIELEPDPEATQLRVDGELVTGPMELSAE